MNLLAIHTAIQTWVVALTGVPTGLVVFTDAPRPNSTSVLVLLNITSSVAKGVDDLVREYDDTTGAETVTTTAAGQRVLSLSIQCQSMDQRPQNNAQQVLERARTRMSIGSFRKILRDANLATATVGQVVNAPYKADGRWYSRYVLDVGLNAVSVESDAGIESMERVSGTGNIGGRDAPFDTEEV